MSFFKEHKVLGIFLVLILVFVVTMCTIRWVRKANGTFKDRNETNQTQQMDTQDTQQEQINTSIKEDTEEEPDSSYTASLGINKDKGDGRVTIKETETEEKKEEDTEDNSPNYNTVVTIFDHTGVPKTNVDGSSYKDYLKNVSMDDFDTSFGGKLTKKDKKTKNRLLVGVEQNKDDYVKGDLQSVGWLINNIDSISSHTAIKFTNLHIIQNISDDGVALFCSYDWYSAFGLKDTMVLFVDESGTLKSSDFSNGDIFSATVYAHNVKVEKVNGYNVVVVKYRSFDE